MDMALRRLRDGVSGGPRVAHIAALMSAFNAPWVWRPEGLTGVPLAGGLELANEVPFLAAGILGVWLVPEVEGILVRLGSSRSWAGPCVLVVIWCEPLVGVRWPSLVSEGVDLDRWRDIMERGKAS